RAVRARQSCGAAKLRLADRGSGVDVPRVGWARRAPAVQAGGGGARVSAIARGRGRPGRHGFWGRLRGGSPGRRHTALLRLLPRHGEGGATRRGRAARPYTPGTQNGLWSVNTQISDGRRSGPWALPSAKSLRLEDFQSGIAVYVVGRDVHLLRLADKRDQ